MRIYGGNLYDVDDHFCCRLGEKLNWGVCVAKRHVGKALKGDSLGSRITLEILGLWFGLFWISKIEKMSTWNFENPMLLITLFILEIWRWDNFFSFPFLDFYDCECWKQFMGVRERSIMTFFLKKIIGRKCFSTI